MREILHYFWRMAPAAALGAAVYLAALLPRKRRLDKIGLTTSGRHEGLLLVFCVFLAGLLWLTVLPEVLWVDGHIVLRKEGFGNVNLRPFLIFTQSRILAQQGFESYFLINFWGNIAMFLPVGLLPALLWRRDRWWIALLRGLGLSLTIELCQIPIRRGTDVDDLWLNTLGTMIGYGLCVLLAHFAPKFVETCRTGGERHGPEEGN